MSRKIAFKTLGCRLNQFETDSLASEFHNAGYRLVDFEDKADVYVVNTCTVTNQSDKKSRNLISQASHKPGDALVVVTGCMVNSQKKALENRDASTYFIENNRKTSIFPMVQAHFEGEILHPNSLDPDVFDFKPADTTFHTRSLVKIQDGCDNACTYCLIHVARGPQRSRPPDQVLAEVQARLDAGHQEIVLTGVHIGAYGRDHQRDLADTDLRRLVARILSETPVPRLRLSSIEPWDLSERAFRLWADPRLCRHLHLPLQSGCDATLRRMARHYTSAEFAALVASARQAIPDLAVTTDVIVGFPGEDDEEFAQSLAFVQHLAFARLHVFPYSLRPGTPAAKMAGQVPPVVKAERSKAMRAVAAASEQAFHRQFVGRTLNVLWEARRAAEGAAVWRGLTDNYIRVQTESAEDLSNTITPTQLLDLVKGGVQGRVVHVTGTSKVPVT